MEDAQKKIQDLRDTGHTDQEIRDYLCDGEALSRSDLDQETVEEMYNIVNNQ